MARFRDDNRMEDIEGCYLLASGWPEHAPEIDILEQIAEFIARIEAKLNSTSNQTRRNWFGNALVFAREAEEFYRRGETEPGRKKLDLAWEQLASGNKANRRRTRFIAGGDGQVQGI